MRKFLLELLARIAFFIGAFGWGFSKAKEQEAKQDLKTAEKRNEIEDNIIKLDPDSRRDRLRTWVPGVQTDKAE